MQRRNLRFVTRRRLLLGTLSATLLVACGSSATRAGGPASSGATTVAVTVAVPEVTSAAPPATASPATTAAAVKNGRTLKIGAIPDAKPDKLTETNNALAAYLKSALGVPVEYVPVNDYPSAVTQFRNGDLDLVWFGGLTGVQARLQTPGSTVLAQRDIDDDFHSVFVANVATGLAPLTSIADLVQLKGKRFTFGSESSTSGRMMPAYFLDQAGIDVDKDFNGPAGYSGSHDKTVDLVAAGTFEVGVLNEQVWKRRSTDGTIDTTKVVEVFRTPGYRDYHWIAGPDTNERFGAGFTAKLKTALLAADASPDGARALALLGGKRFISTDPANYDAIEAIGRKLGLIN